MSETMKRPSMADDYVRRRASELYMPAIRRWHNGEQFEERETVEQLMKVVSPHGDGYEMARELERDHGWYVDSNLVGVLEDCASFCDDAIAELTRQWVICLGIQLAYAVGDRVRLAVNLGGRKEGVIVKVEHDLAKYGVHTEGQSEKAYWVVECEKVLGLVEAEEERVA